MKRVMKIVIIGLCLGIVLVLIQNSFGIQEKEFLHVYWILAPIVVIGAALINICYNLFYSDKIKKSVRLLDEGKVPEYIESILKLLKSAKGQNLRKVLKLNLAAGYMEERQFEKAILMLEELSEKGLKGSAVNAVHRINLCLCYFETEQYDKAMKVYNENRVLIRKYENDGAYGGYIILLDIMAAIINEKYDLAGELLDKAKNKYTDMRLQKAFQEFQGVINSK